MATNSSNCPPWMRSQRYKNRHMAAMNIQQQAEQSSDDSPAQHEPGAGVGPDAGAPDAD